MAVAFSARYVLAKTSAAQPESTLPVEIEGG